MLKRNQPNWTAVLIYYAIACGFSWPFFWWSSIRAGGWDSSAAPLWLRAMGLMWGPGVAALVCLMVFRKTHQRTITLWGTSKVRSVCFYALPLLLLALTHPPAARLFRAIFKDPAAHPVTPLLFTLWAGLGFCRILGEELGWRGFLQDALRPLRFAPRFVSIGILWEFWHVMARAGHNSPVRIAVMLAISYPSAILLSFIIGMAVERSQSLAVAVSLHLWVDYAFYLHTRAAGIVLGISILFWVYLLWRWPRQTRSLSAAKAPMTSSVPA